MTKIRIGSRESRLAMVQAEMAAAAIRRVCPEAEVQIIGYTTKGDQLLQEKLALIGGKGLFVKELELALLNNEIDFAVHSAKDMPAQLPDGLEISGALPRADHRDVLISRYGSWQQLPQGAVVGTSSIRREVQMQALRPDVQFRTLRGNVITRLQKYDDGQYDAILLAKAGLDRLGIQRPDAQLLSEQDMLPAACQGIIALEGRCGDPLRQQIGKIFCVQTQLLMECERSFMLAVGGDCTAPVAALARMERDEVVMQGMSQIDGQLKRCAIRETCEHHAKMGQILAERLQEL